MENLKKLDSWNGEWGDTRGNCSGLLEGCLRTKSYNTCNKPCIKGIEETKDTKDTKRLYVDYDLWKKRYDVDNFIKQEIMKGIQLYINKTMNNDTDLLYMMKDSIYTLIERKLMDDKIDKLLLNIINNIDDEGKIKDYILERFLTKISV